MNLRGTVIPIVDLRSRFDMPAADYNQFTVIIVVSVGSKVVGLVVDAVSDVLNIAKDQIEDTPEVGSDGDTSFFHGMGKVGDKLVLLLNIDRLLGNENLEVAEAGNRLKFESTKPIEYKPLFLNCERIESWVGFRS